MRNVHLVSVIVPAFNAAPFILDTLKSIAAQTFEDFQCLVCDDGSTDSTSEVVAGFCRGDRRFQLHRQAVNRGVAYTRNRGIASSCGEYIAISDADDYWYPMKLERQIAVMGETKSDLVFSLVEVKSPEGRTARMFPRALTEAMFSSPSEAFVRALRFNVAVCGSNILWKRSAMRQGFSEHLCPGDDWDFLLWMARHRRIALCPHIDVRYQRREGSITGVHPHLPTLYLAVLKSWIKQVSPSEWSRWQALQEWAERLQGTLYPCHKTMTSPYDTNWEEMADYHRIQSQFSEKYQADIQAELRRQKDNA